MFRFIEGAENPVEFTPDGKYTFEFRSGLVVETGRSARRLLMRRPASSIVNDIDDQLANMDYPQRRRAQEKAADMMGYFTIGSALRVGTRTVTGAVLIGAGALTAAILASPVGAVVLGASLAVAGGRLLIERSRVKKFAAAYEKYSGKSLAAHEYRSQRRRPARVG